MTSSSMKLITGTKMSNSKLGIHESKEHVVDEHLAIAEYMPFHSLCEHCW